MTMKLSNVAVVLGVAAAMTSMPSHADDHLDEARGNHRSDSGMQAISIDTTIGQPGYGWRYFADARKGRAVAISPSGDYFYSDGHDQGPTLVFKATGAP
jgi:hypothetical protein